MTLHHFTISAEGMERHKSLRPAMSNAYDASICSVFRYPADQLTVFPGAGIARTFVPSDIPSKIFAWGGGGGGRESQEIRQCTNPDSSMDLRVQAIDGEISVRLSDAFDDQPQGKSQLGDEHDRKQWVRPLLIVREEIQLDEANHQG